METIFEEITSRYILRIEQEDLGEIGIIRHIIVTDRKNNEKKEFGMLRSAYKYMLNNQ